MLKKLQAKWKVNHWRLLLIIITFAAGGSLCGFAGRKILLAFNVDKNVTWVFLYIILITILWPFCVLLVSIPLGQFAFFKKYLSRIRNRILLQDIRSADTNLNIAVFASGAGTNAKKIIEHFKNNAHIKIALIVSNKPDAGVISIAKDNNIPYLVTDKNLTKNQDIYISKLKNNNIDLIVMAGFLSKLPTAFIQAFPKRIINIHPSLLPYYGGKGMYGKHVHEAVISNQEKQSGITIHYADEIYDHGEILFQAACDVTADDTTETLAKKIQLLEHTHYPVLIENILKAKNKLKRD